MPNELLHALNEAVVRRLAGDQSYRRGQDYFLHGHVTEIEDDDDAVRASVRGSQDYTVELSAEDGILDYACDCPVGGDGEFCKHCVAAALAWMQRSKRPAKAAGKSKKLTMADVQKVLLSEDKVVLVEHLIEWAKSDKELRERLVMYAARRSKPEVLLSTVQQAFSKAISVRRYVEYREMPGFVRRINAVIDSIEELLKDGQAAGVIGLCESSIQSLSAAIESVDDSDGYMSGLLERLKETHLDACREAPPEPVAMAKRLFELELGGDFDVFSGAVGAYAKVLGPKGLIAYRKLAEEEWAKVPELPPSAPKDNGKGRYRITHIMETLAKLSGDTEELVRVMSKDLSYPYYFLKIAEVYGNAGQHDNALLWAERGLKAFPKDRDHRLCEFLADEYHRRKRHAEAMELIWQGFAGRPGLESYRKLKSHAEKANGWQEWRDRALAEVRRRIKPASQSKPAKYVWQKPEEHSLLVQIFLYEGDADAAWREAQQGGCRDSLWLELAAARGKDHPEDAIPIYLTRAEADIAARSNGSYHYPVDLLAKAAALMSRVGKSKDFAALIESLRFKYKRKRNFIKLLDETALCEIR